ncbi:tyrosine-type recombinase/integrase [Pseudonocardia oroxyli]|uniref:Site-specific recombinase XerD n=1 Tax=Pseudonocardia oroxyli TaxID=366584 RepID=A0A1G7YL60_PSEOR|nr:tyrosine-type recombinase/integrase [Pseudonocardia oroxyli]SDG97278.1 Site-specific recombinase XerD [Pseudonocardia oroxyli]
MPRSRPLPDLGALLDSWVLHLRAERKSAETVDNYTTGVRQFLAWCQAQGCPAVLDRPTVNGFVAALLDRGAEAATARSRQLAVRRFSTWCAEEDEIERDELIGLRPPKLDQKVTERLTDEQITALVKACAGREFRDRRDEAIIRLMIETGVRAGEVMALAVADVDLSTGRAVVRRGKGGKGRPVPFGAQTGRALDRYLRTRRAHRLADTPPLWLGDRGKGLSYDGLYRALRGRAERAGIEGFHPHTLRHTAAQRWLSAGGSEGALMAVAGWTRRDMLDRYTRATAAERAAEEAARLGLGDFG